MDVKSKTIGMYKVAFTILLSLFPFFDYAQIKSKTSDISSDSTDQNLHFIKVNQIDCIHLPFGYTDLSKITAVDSIIAAIEDGNKLREFDDLEFKNPIKKDVVLLPEEYHVFMPFNIDVNEKSKHIKLASHFMCHGDYVLHFMAVYNTVLYASPFIEKMYLVSTKEGKLMDMKRIYLNHQGESGFSNYTLFNINGRGIISLRDYEFTDSPFQLKPLVQYDLLPSGKFAWYYDLDGSYKTHEEQGLVKNHHKEGKWIELKPNRSLDLQKYTEFTDTYTYLEAVYKNGLPAGKWKFYQLLQKFNEETGAPLLNTGKKGRLIYTETYLEGSLMKRKFY